MEMQNSEIEGGNKVELEELVNGEIKAVVKRSGQPVAFDEEKIAKAIFKAAKRVGGDDYEIAKAVARKVHNNLNSMRDESGNYPHSNKKTPHIEDIQDMVEKTLNENGYKLTGAMYHVYRKLRQKVRDHNELQVTGQRTQGDSTDQALLLVDAISKDNREAFNHSKITMQIIEETDVPIEVAEDVAKEVEADLIFAGYKIVDTNMIKSMVNAKFAQMGYKEALETQELLGMSIHDLETIIFGKSVENSNVGTNNPEAVNLAIAEDTLKKYALKRIFSKPVADAHMAGKIHLHDLGMPVRVYCSSHSVEYLKKYGLDLDNLQATSKPAKHSHTLTGHLNTFIASKQAYYAGALGVSYINIMYAPLLENDLKERESIIDSMFALKTELEKLDQKNESIENLITQIEEDLKTGDKDELRKKFLKQQAQYMIFSGAQNAFSRGGQTVFLDFNIHAGVPDYLKEVPAIGPGGNYMFRDSEGNIHNLTEVKQTVKDEGTGKFVENGLKDLKLDDRLVFTERRIHTDHGDRIVQKQVKLKDGERVLTYGDYEKTAQEFAEAMLEVWGEGDPRGLPFSFPKCDFHVDEKTFTDPSHEKVFDKACEVASKNGSTYFVFDRDAATLSACCRLRTTIEDDLMIKHPESLRFCGFQNVTINLPQASYRVGKNNLEGVIEEVDKMIGLAIDAHLQKKEYIAKLQQPGRPQWQTGKITPDGKPYVDLEKSTYIVGLLGMNELVQHQTGKQLDELTEEETKNIPLRIVAHMNKKLAQYSEELGLKFTLEESPAESTTRRLSKLDLVKFPEDAREVVKGSIEDDETYYSNSIHPRPDAPMSIEQRIEYQSKYHTGIDSGAIIHCFVGEKIPSQPAIKQLMKDTYYNTQAAQVTISPEFTACNNCGHFTLGLFEVCPKCTSEDTDAVTRIVGYYSKKQNWNKSKKGELKDRQAAKKTYRPAGIPFKQNINYAIKARNGKTEAIVFGKEGCDKCSDLKQRLSAHIEENGLQDKAELVYQNMSQEQGFADSMWYQINPSRIPTLVIVDKEGEKARFEPDYTDINKMKIKEKDFAPYLKA